MQNSLREERKMMGCISSSKTHTTSAEKSHGAISELIKNPLLTAWCLQITAKVAPGH